MAKYKLHKDVAGSKSFRFNGNKYDTKSVLGEQKMLKKLYNDGFQYVSEIKESVKKSVKNDKKENDNAND
tara:strand:+ start:2492 stop:2701 length:210 start_codon:yes stop_codon:yes gene_type:complete